MDIKITWAKSLIALAVVSVIAWIAYETGQPEYCCAHPLARGPSIWEKAGIAFGFVGVLSGIAIAVGTNIATNKRFFRQIRAEMRLDKKADKRQQAEWNKRKIEQNRIYYKEQVAILHALFNEIFLFTRNMQNCACHTTQVDKLILIPIQFLVHDSMKKMPWKLPPEYHALDGMVFIKNHSTACNEVTIKYNGVERTQELIDGQHKVYKQILEVSAIYCDQLKKIIEDVNIEIKKF